MEQILATANLDNSRSIHIASLARQTIIDAGAEHLGFGGYFIFEVDNSIISRGVNILAKVASFEAAMELIDLWTKKVA